MKNKEAIGRKLRQLLEMVVDAKTQLHKEPHRATANLSRAEGKIYSISRLLLENTDDDPEGN